MPGSVNSRVVTDNELTGTDIDESTLNMPATTTATFAGATPQALGDAFSKVASKTLPAGSWAIVATANTASSGPFGGDIVRDTVCELRNGNSFIGGARDRRLTPDGGQTHASLSMNGGAQVPAGGGEVSLWCRYQGGSGFVDSGQMMMIRLDGFS